MEEREEEESSTRRRSGRGYSPHSTTTTGTTPPSRKRVKPKEEEEEESATAVHAGSSATSDSDVDTSADKNSTHLKYILAATIKLSGSISRQHSDRALQIITDLLVSWIPFFARRFSFSGTATFAICSFSVVGFHLWLTPISSVIWREKSLHRRFWHVRLRELELGGD